MIQGPGLEEHRVDVFVFHDLEEAVETIANENLDYRQLDSGPIRIKLAEREAWGLSVMRSSVDKLLDGFGVIPEGRVHFELCLGGEGSHLYSEQEYTAGDCYLAPSGTGGHQLLRPGFEAFGLSFSEELLGCYLGKPLDLPKECKVQAICPTTFTRLTALCSEFMVADFGEAGGRNLVDQMATLVCNGFPDSSRNDRLPACKRSQALLARKARDLLVEFQELTLGDICREVGLSDRALRRLFTEVYGISPGQYRLAVQLNRVRTELKHSPPRKGAVSAVAARHGFWHMGRFGSQYRRLFQECPSETLFKFLR